jgi:hypothetical protein
MPCIVTTVHDPVALAVTCQRLSLPRPELGTVHLDDREPFGWIVRLPGVRFPIVCDTLTGLVAYHPSDNAFGRYRSIMFFVRRYYEIKTQLRRGAEAVRSTPVACEHYTLGLTAQAG